jgi:hypothetical protein
LFTNVLSCLPTSKKGSISHGVIAEAIMVQPSASYETSDVLSLLRVQGHF